MGIDDFFEDDYLDFDSDDDFEESLQSESFISKINNFKDSITPKHIFTFTGVLASIFIIYFIRFYICLAPTFVASFTSIIFPVSQ